MTTSLPNSQELEIEVAYLLTSIPAEMAQVAAKRITDIYLSDGYDLLTKLRLRQNGDKYELTKKVVVDPADLSVQHEFTIPLSATEFERLKAVDGRAVIKDRYSLPLAGMIAEVDVFRGYLEGLAIIEFEFPSIADRDSFVPPACCGADVTQEDFIAGAYLAGLSYEDIATDLKRYNYKPLSYK